MKKRLEYRKIIISLLECTSWQQKDQPVRLYRANQQGVPLEIVIMRDLLLVIPGERKPVKF